MLLFRTLVPSPPALLLVAIFCLFLVTFGTAGSASFSSSYSRCLNSVKLLPLPSALIETETALTFSYSYSTRACAQPGAPSLLFRMDYKNTDTAPFLQPVDLTGPTSFWVANLQAGSYYMLIVDASSSSSEPLSRIWFHVFSSAESLPSRGRSPRATPSDLSYSSLRPLSPGSSSSPSSSAPRPRVLLVGQSAFDGQLYRYLELAAGLSISHYDVRYLTFSAIDGGPSAVVALSAAFAAAGATFSHAQIPGVSLESVLSESSNPLSSTPVYDPVKSPPCAASESAATCIRDGSVEYLLSRLAASLTPPTDVTPAWAGSVWASFLAGLAGDSSSSHHHPDVVIISCTGFQQDKLVAAAARRLPSRPLILLDLSSLDIPLGMSFDAALAPSKSAAAAVRERGRLASARPFPAPAYVVPPSLGDGLWSCLTLNVCPPAPKAITQVSDFLTEGNCGPAARASKRCLVAGFIGRLSPEKGAPLALDAFAIAHREVKLATGRDLFLVFVGGGHQLPSLTAQARLLGVDRFVAFTGFVENAALPHALKLFDFVVNPSISPETFCISNAEAMAAGLVIVGWGLGGPRDYLVDGFNAVLLDDREFGVDVLAKGMQAIAKDDDARDAMGNNAKTLAREAYKPGRGGLELAALISSSKQQQQQQQQRKADKEEEASVPSVAFFGNLDNVELYLSVMWRCDSRKEEARGVHVASASALCDGSNRACRQAVEEIMDEACEWGHKGGSVVEEILDLRDDAIVAEVDVGGGETQVVRGFVFQNLNICLNPNNDDDCRRLDELSAEVSMLARHHSLLFSAWEASGSARLQLW